MPTNLALDNRLVGKAKRIGGHRTNEAAITAALEEYIQRREQLRILELAGKIDYDRRHDPKALRRKKRP